MIPYKSQLTAIKDIEERNKAFDSLSDEDKRKEIALDAFNLVLAGKLYPSYGSYWGDYLMDIEAKDSKDFQKILLNELPECEVCQRGLFMVSQIRLGNSICSLEKSRDNGNGNIIKGFKIEDFLSMENEYEKCRYNHPYENNSKEKMLNICCNVIYNGNFYINDKTDYLTKWKIKLL